MPKIPLLIVFKVETDVMQSGINEVEYTYNTIACTTESGATDTNITQAKERDLKSIYNLRIWNDNIIQLYTDTDAVPLVSRTQRTIDYPTREQHTDVKKATAYCKQIIDAYKEGYAFVKLGRDQYGTKFFLFQKLTELRPIPEPSPQPLLSPSHPPQTPARHLPIRIAQPLSRNELEELREKVNKLVDFLLTTTT
jgi:hypothetical protein